MNYCKLYFGSVALALCFASSANAAIIGTLKITGSMQVNAVGVDWYPTGSGTGSFNTVALSSGFFSGIFNPAGSPAYTGVVKDLNSVSQPVGVPIFLNSYLSNFSAPGYSSLTYDLTRIFASSAPICTGAESLNTPCALAAGSPFTLSNTAQGVNMLFGVGGFFQFPGELDSYATGNYTAAFSGASIASVLQVLGAGGSFDFSYSADFTVGPEPGTTVPEPGATTLMAAGFGLMAAYARRKRS